MLFGLVPALRVCRLDLHDNLKDATRGATGGSALWGRGRNMRRLLVMGELALSVVLLIAAGLLIRSFVRLQQVPTGFNASNVLTLELTMTGRRYNEPQAVLEAYRQMWDRLSHLPGASAAGGVSALPLSQMFARAGSPSRGVRCSRAKRSSTSISASSPATTSVRWRFLS